MALKKPRVAHQTRYKFSESVSQSGVRRQRRVSRIRVSTALNLTRPPLPPPRRPFPAPSRPRRVAPGKSQGFVWLAWPPARQG